MASEDTFVAGTPEYLGPVIRHGISQLRARHLFQRLRRVRGRWCAAISTSSFQPFLDNVEFRLSLFLRRHHLSGFLLISILFSKRIHQFSRVFTLCSSPLEDLHLLGADRLLNLLLRQATQLVICRAQAHKVVVGVQIVWL